jgi:Bacterial membrane protein YfhO
VGPGGTDGWDEVVGLNLLWLAAAIAAPFFCPGRTRYEAGVGLALLFFAMGGASVVHWLPGFGLFQIPIRMAMLLALPIALLAGRTTQILVSELHRDRIHAALARHVLVRVLIAGLVVGACGAWVALPHTRPTTVVKPINWDDEFGTRHWLYWLILLITGPLMLWLLSKRCPVHRIGWQIAWVAVLLGDAWSLTWTNVGVRAPSMVYQVSEGVDLLADRRRETPHDHWRVFDRGVPGFPSTAPLGPSLPLFGQVQLEPVLSYNPIDIRRYKEYLQFIEDKDEPIAPGKGIFGYPIIQAFPIENKKLLDLLGSKYAFGFLDESLCFSARGEPGVNPRWEQLPLVDRNAVAFSFLAGGMQRVPAYTIYENRDVLPRAFTLTKAVLLADRPNVLAQMKGTDFHRAILLEGSFPIIETSDHDDDFRPAQITGYTPNRVEMVSDRPEPSYLVLTDVWFPGWKCTIDGSPTEIFRANFLFRAISLPAGKHDIVFTFEPESYRVGKIVSVCGLMLLLAATSVALLRKRVQKGVRHRCAQHPSGRSGNGA